MRKVQYESLEHKEQLMNEAFLNGEILNEDAILLDGNFLTFVMPEEIQPQPKTDMQILQEAVDTLILNALEV